MRKSWIARLLTVLLVLLASAACAEADFTLLVYMCGTDIQSDACEDIYEMGLAENGSGINVVVLAGGAETWDYEEIQGGSRTLLSIRNGAFESIEDWGWASMGSGDCLLEFLEYGLREYPAERTAVVLWNHGAGSEGGICFDETARDDDGLTLVEIRDALEALRQQTGGFHLDLFGCDACMMATYEMAALLSQFDIDCFVASEELEPGTGWSYSPWLQALEQDPSLSTPDLCAIIVESYMEQAQEGAPDNPLTLSAIDLRQMEALCAAMEDLGENLQVRLNSGRMSEIRRGRSQLYTFGSFADGSWDMVDLGALLDACARLDAEGAARARAALSKAVLLTRQTADLNPCSGLSVLIPQDTRGEFEAYSEGLDLSMYIPQWMGFIKAYARELNGGSYTFSQTTPQALSGTGFFSQISALLNQPEEEWIWNGDTESYEESVSSGVSGSALADDYAFSAVLTAEDMQYLDYVEGMMMLDVSDEESFGYVDLGLIQNNVIDWGTGEIYSLFDGTWPTLGGQLVPLYDQISNDFGRRSLIPVKLNGDYTYLVVEFEPGSAEGRVLGANAGYDDNGLPIRHTTRLSPGDRIVPVYTLYLEVDGNEEMEETEFEGEELIWEDGLRVSYEALSEDGEPVEMMFCFVLNDIFGDYGMTDIISFEI